MRERAGGQAVRRSVASRSGGIPAPDFQSSPEPLTACPPARLTAGWERRGALWVQLRQKIEGCLSDFRRIVGMPDYAGYLRHLQAVHPDWPVPSEREFFRLYVESRYGGGATRCC
jgi:uncharacterized short protein YbdD (DUF466 family)